MFVLYIGDSVGAIRFNAWVCDRRPAILVDTLFLHGQFVPSRTDLVQVHLLPFSILNEKMQVVQDERP
jgi:hypothetical protein